MVETLIKTALYSLHIEQQAKMVPFAGYAMPVHYTRGIIQEHLHTRSKAGLFDISHMGQIIITGAQAAEELEMLTPSDITGLNPGQQRYTVFTNADGGIIDDLIVTNLGAKLLLIVNASRKQLDLTYLEAQLSEQCCVKHLNDHSLLAIQGPDAARIMQSLVPETVELSFMNACETNIEGISCSISRSGYTGEDGFEISVSDVEAEQLARRLLADDSVELIGLGARDTLRLEAGLCLYGNELTESITPVEAGLSWILKKQHFNFPGAAVIKQQLADQPQQRRVGLHTETKTPMRAGTEILTTDGRHAGFVSSGSYAPSANRPIAIAYVITEHAVIGNSLIAKIRNRQVHVTVAALPFIAHRYQRQ